MSVRHLLTQGITFDELPLAPLSLQYRVAIEDVVRIAWTRISASAGGRTILAEGNENEITVRLEAEIESLRLGGGAPGFSQELFAAPIRGGAFMDYAGKHIEKSPDLAIRLKACRPGVPHSVNLYDATFIECKVLSPGTAVRKYAQDGVLRFVSGQYAWAVRHGLMLGYVREDVGVQDLAELLQRSNDTLATSCETTEMPNLCAVSEMAPPAYSSKHDRPWRFANGGNPSGIELRHLWLRT